MSAADADLRLLRDRRLAAFFTARTLSSFAMQMQVVAIGWQIYALTHSTLALGLVGAAQFLPVFCLTFVVGHVLDRFDRARIARLCVAADTICSATLAIGSAAHVLTPTLIYVLVAAFGTARAFESPAMQALLPALVSREGFSRAAALSSSLFTVATIVGPSLGGLLTGFGPFAPYAVCACAYAVATVALSLTGHPAPNPENKRPKVTLESIFGGLTFLRAHPEILGAISLDLFAVLLGGATALLPVYARDILHVGPEGLGVLRAAPAIGALVLSLLLARHPVRHHAGAVMFASVAIFGVATIVFGVSRSLPLSAAALAVAGAADIVSVVIRSTLIQLRTPDEMRGRVAAVNMLFVGSSNQLGEFESGLLATAIGTVPAVVLGGIGTLATVAAFLRLFPGLRTLDRIE